jgi:hypothetical protein
MTEEQATPGFPLLDRIICRKYRSITGTALLSVHPPNCFAILADYIEARARCKFRLMQLVQQPACVRPGRWAPSTADNSDAMLAKGQHRAPRQKTSGCPCSVRALRTAQDAPRLQPRMTNLTMMPALSSEESS